MAAEKTAVVIVGVGAARVSLGVPYDSGVS